MEKIYILDTNVLIQAPYAVECFEENEVVLPMTVLEELDNLKKEEGEKGANVRRVIRILDAYREKEICWRECIRGMAVSCGWKKII